MKRWRSKKAPTPDCPIKALVEQLTTEGWTVAVPFSIPNDCFAGTCGHTPQDTWALAYARHGRGLVRDIENGKLTVEDGKLTFEDIPGSGI